jgi:ArsR family transcriptional regulator
MDSALDLFAALSDPIRLRGLALMARRDELCVWQLTRALAISQPRMSKHLAALRAVGLVRDRRDAQWVLYSLAPDLPAWVEAVVDVAIGQIVVTSVHAADLERLSTISGPDTLMPMTLPPGEAPVMSRCR